MDADKVIFVLLCITIPILTFEVLLLFFGHFYRYYSQKKLGRTMRMIERIVNQEEQQPASLLPEQIAYFDRDYRKDCLIEVLSKREDKRSNEYFIQKVNLQSYLLNKLNKSNGRNQAELIRNIGDLGSRKLSSKIWTYINDSNEDVRYNTILAISNCGDIEGMRYIFSEHYEKISLSYRALVEIISRYAGNLEELFLEIIELCDDYYKSIFIKTLAPYKCKSLADYYIRIASSSNVDLRIACIRALGQLEDNRHEAAIIKYCRDESWEVRAAVAKALNTMGNVNNTNVLMQALYDDNWWVRKNAAAAFVKTASSAEINMVLKGSDKYAIDALVSELETRGLQPKLEKVVSLESIEPVDLSRLAINN